MTERYKEVAVADADTAVLEQTDVSEEESSAAAASRLVVSLWLSDSVRNRLVAAGGLQIVDDLDRIGSADLIAVSTRIPPGESPARIAELRQQATCPT